MEPPMMPPKRDESLITHTVVTTILHGLCLAGLFVVLVVRVPKFHEIFKSLGTELPTITVVVLNISVWCTRYALLVFPGLGLVLAGYAVVYYFARKNCRPVWHILWSGACYALFLLAVMLITQAMFLPLFQLMNAVESK